MSTSFTQTTLPIQITTPLGANKLLVRSVEGEEKISEPFLYTVEMASQDPGLTFSDILGKPVTLQIPQSSGDIHYICGIVGKFVQSGQDQLFSYYRAEIRPSLWLLTLSADCAIYQNLAAPDIIKQVFSNLGFSDYTDKLTGSYQTLDFCVQYRETAFAFVSRLMEQAGIFYFFTHDSSGQKMVLADDASAWTTPVGLTSATYTQDQRARTTDLIVTECFIEQNMTTGQFKTDDYNFETPATDLLASADGANTSLSVYDFPGLYTAQSDGESLASLRLSALESSANWLSGASLCRAFYTGCKFTLAGHYRSTANTAYVIHTLRVSATQTAYKNTFEAFPATLSYRPPLKTPRPVIAGTQVAVVVGKSGEEIWTDQYGRIVIQFFWDQKGQNNENSSCYIRVAQPWAGKQWGGIFIPRIGQEVIVSFLDGNPDRPVVLGTLYNAAQTVPYALPTNQTRSTIKTSSSTGGSGNNEICFEDKAGSEELFMQAQKDMTLTVLNDLTSTVSGNISSTVNGNYTLTVKGNISIQASGSVSIQSGTTFANTSGTTFTNKSGSTLTNQAGSDLTNKADQSLTNQAGSTLTNQAATSLTNKGATVTNQGTTSQTVDGGTSLTLKGAAVQVTA